MSTETCWYHFKIKWLMLFPFWLHRYQHPAQLLLVQSDRFQSLTAGLLRLYPVASIVDQPLFDISIYLLVDKLIKIQCIFLSEGAILLLTVSDTTKTKRIFAKQPIIAIAYWFRVDRYVSVLWNVVNLFKSNLTLTRSCTTLGLVAHPYCNA